MAGRPQSAANKQPPVFQRYKVLCHIGDGAFGSVSKAQQQDGELVAVKRMKRKYTSWQECIDLREIKSLAKLAHPNIVKLKEVIRENDELFMIFEYCDGTLYRRMQQYSQENRSFDEQTIRSYMGQVLSGMSFMHKHGFFHRDMKPENLLFAGDCLKLADFGLAREIRSRPPFTEYVATRWYRAPEILLHASHYNSPVDLWAIGVIMAELFLMRPLLPGTSESDQLFRITQLLGTPTQDTWREGVKLASNMNYKFADTQPTPLGTLLPNASPHAQQVIADLLRWDPQRRPRADEILTYPFFTQASVTATSVQAQCSTTEKGDSGPNITNGEMGTSALLSADLDAILGTSTDATDKLLAEAQAMIDSSSSARPAAG